jgi:hypothetical protein
VYVFNANGSFNREVSVTGAEYAALAQPGAGAPAGVQAGERWEASGIDFALGDVADVDGELWMLDEQAIVNGRTIDQYLVFLSGEWSGVLPAVQVAPTALSVLPVERRPVSIVDGVVVR